MSDQIAGKTLRPQARPRWGIRDRKDFVSGALFVAVGVLAVVVAHDYPMGSERNMGPGAFPTAVASVLIVLGVIKLVRSLIWAEAAEIGMLALRPLLLVPVGVVMVGLLILRAGLIPAIFVLILIACLAGGRQKPIEMLLIFVVVTLIASILWVYGLGFPAQSLLWL